MFYRIVSQQPRFDDAELQFSSYKGILFLPTFGDRNNSLDAGHVAYIKVYNVLYWSGVTASVRAKSKDDPILAQSVA